MPDVSGAVGPQIMQDPGQQQMPTGLDPAIGNQLMLAAIKGGAGGGVTPSMAPPSMPPPPPAPVSPPVDPNSMQGGLGDQQQMQGMGQMPFSQMGLMGQQPVTPEPPNPLVNALMNGQIPGGQ